MYAGFYGLTHSPFGMPRDSRQIFLAPTHREALSAIIYGALERKPFTVVLGEVGLGKTTVLNAALAGLAEQGARILRYWNPLAGADGLVRLIGGEAGLADAPALGVADMERACRALAGVIVPGGRAVLVVDDAQSLAREPLELLRLMSDLPFGEASLQVVLVGQPEFGQALQTHALRSLRQRVALQHVIEALPPREARDYLRYRIELAGGSLPGVMTRWAVAAIVRRARGIPRRLNTLADTALIAGYAAGRRRVTARLVRQAAAVPAGGLHPQPQAYSLRWL